MSRSERNACAAAARERELQAARELWNEFPEWSRLRVAQILAKPPGARSRRAIYSDLPIREQVMQRKGSRIT